MTIDRDDIFEHLEPPSGGLARLRARLEAQSTSPWRSRRLVALPTAAAALWLALVSPWGPYRLALLADPARQPDAVAIDRGSDATFIALGLHEAGDEAVTVHPHAEGRTAVREVPVADEGVLFYMVASLDEP